ncbi:MAG: YigZ family protein [Flavobacteriaceae bacterium]|nr:YigZ family protein [Flavobacteriaceae bacterium]
MSRYKTIASPVEDMLFKERKSKFIGYAYPIENETEAKSLLENLRKKHAQANHVCFAYRLGNSGETYRSFDDGEPNNSAGAPIYGQLLSFDVTGVLVAVVRYFGGVKLGVGGLVSAYKSAALLTLEQADIVVKESVCRYKIKCAYKDLSQTQKIIKNVGGDVLQLTTSLDCELDIVMPESAESQFLLSFEQLYEVVLTKKASCT